MLLARRGPDLRRDVADHPHLGIAHESIQAVPDGRCQPFRCPRFLSLINMSGSEPWPRDVLSV